MTVHSPEQRNAMLDPPPVSAPTPATPQIEPRITIETMHAGYSIHLHRPSAPDNDVYGYLWMDEDGGWWLRGRVDTATEGEGTVEAVLLMPADAPQLAGVRQTEPYQWALLAALTHCEERLSWVSMS